MCVLLLARSHALSCPSPTADNDEDFEARLARLRKKSKPQDGKAADGEFTQPRSAVAERETEKLRANSSTQSRATPPLARSHHSRPSPSLSTRTAPSSTPAPIARAAADYTDEQLHYESGPHPGDLLVNAALGATLVWLPLTAASLGRAAFVRYRFTDRRLSVMTSAPWKQEQLDADYRDIKDVKTVGRGVGLWGDMVITLTSGDKVELRALPQFVELREYVLARRDALGGNRSVSAAKADRIAERLEKAAAAKGFGKE